jgi:TPR repeat protein
MVCELLRRVFSKIFQFLLHLAERGYGEAQYRIGLIYENGDGVEQYFEGMLLV